MLSPSGRPETVSGTWGLGGVAQCLTVNCKGFGMVRCMVTIEKLQESLPGYGQFQAQREPIIVV